MKSSLVRLVLVLAASQSVWEGVRTQFSQASFARIDVSERRWRTEISGVLFSYPVSKDLFTDSDSSQNDKELAALIAASDNSHSSRESLKQALKEVIRSTLMPRDPYCIFSDEFRRAIRFMYSVKPRNQRASYLQREIIALLQSYEAPNGAAYALKRLSLESAYSCPTVAQSSAQHAVRLFQFVGYEDEAKSWYRTASKLFKERNYTSGSNFWDKYEKDVWKKRLFPSEGPW